MSARSTWTSRAGRRRWSAACSPTGATARESSSRSAPSGSSTRSSSGERPVSGSATADGRFGAGSEGSSNSPTVSEMENPTEAQRLQLQQTVEWIRHLLGYFVQAAGFFIAADALLLGYGI